MSDDKELVSELRRVAGDLDFRAWLRRVLRFLLIVLCLDLLLSLGCATSLVGVRYVQHDACQHDNVRAAAYVDQWQPILDLPVAPLPPGATDEQRRTFEAQQHTRLVFQRQLNDGFAPRDCSLFVELPRILAIGGGLIAVVVAGVVWLAYRIDRRWRA